VTWNQKDSRRIASTGSDGYWCVMPFSNFNLIWHDLLSHGIAVMFLVHNVLEWLPATTCQFSVAVTRSHAGTASYPWYQMV